MGTLGFRVTHTYKLKNLLKDGWPPPWPNYIGEKGCNFCSIRNILRKTLELGEPFGNFMKWIGNKKTNKYPLTRKK